MGNILKRYCDWNGEAMEGVSYQLALSDMTGGVPAQVVMLDLCGACFMFWQTYLKNRRGVVDAAWTTNPAAIVKIEPK